MIDVLIDITIKIDGSYQHTRVIRFTYKLPFIMPVGTFIRLPAPSTWEDPLICTIESYSVGNGRILVNAETAIGDWFSQSTLDELASIGYYVFEECQYQGLFADEFRQLDHEFENHTKEVDFATCLNNSESELSGRARNVLHNSGIQSFSQITKWNLSQLRHCGKQTVDEILAWAKSKASE